MKKLLTATILVAMISSCINYPLVGYIVCKEHVLQHMSNESAHAVTEASMVYIPVSHPVHTPPHLIEDDFIVYVANKQGVYDIHVSQKTFQSLKLRDKVKVVNNSIDKL